MCVCVCVCVCVHSPPLLHPADGIHILIDLLGFSRGARPQLFAFRPAPLSVTLPTYPDTVAAVHRDYIIADAVTAPDGAGHTSAIEECLVRLPTTACAAAHRELFRGVLNERAGPRREEVGLKEGGVALACFAQPAKISEEVFAVWCRVLRECPEAEL